MIIHYNTITNVIFGYAITGGVIPDDIPDGEGYFSWDGITPNPVQNFTVLNDTVVAKSSDDVEAIATSQQSRYKRSERDKLLLASDYTRLSDSPLSTLMKTRYETYRSKLRNAPRHPNWPDVDFDALFTSIVTNGDFD